MPPVRSFAALGLFVRENFLSREERDTLAAAMIAGTAELAGLVGDTVDGTLNPDIRRAFEVDVPSYQAVIDARLLELRAELEQYFHVRLAPPDSSSYLRYPPGAFYRAHKDRPEIPDASGANRRAVSVVLFVNGPRDDPGYAGGHLRFYGLLGDGRLADVGLDAEPEGGTLVAFPSTLQHEVTEVERGVRCTVVAWFAGGGVRS